MVRRRRKEREMGREGVKKVDKEFDSSEGGRRQGIRRRTHRKTDGWIDGKKSASPYVSAHHKVCYC